MGRTPRSVAKHFYGSIAEGEYDKALAVTTLADDADPEIYYAIMDKVSRSIEERGGIERIEVTAERVAEDEAVVGLTLRELAPIAGGLTHAGDVALSMGLRVELFRVAR